MPPRLLQPRDPGHDAPRRFVDWAFGHYLRIAPPAFAGSPAAARAPRRASRAA